MSEDNNPINAKPFGMEELSKMFSPLPVTNSMGSVTPPGGQANSADIPEILGEHMQDGGNFNSHDWFDQRLKETISNLGPKTTITGREILDLLLTGENLKWLNEQHENAASSSGNETKEDFLKRINMREKTINEFVFKKFTPQKDDMLFQKHEYIKEEVCTWIGESMFKWMEENNLAISPETREFVESTIKKSSALPMPRVEPAEVQVEIPSPKYLFQKTANTWKIIFDGKEIMGLKDLNGMTYIHALLQKPGQEVSCKELYSINSPLSPSNPPNPLLQRGSRAFVTPLAEFYFTLPIPP